MSMLNSLALSLRHKFKGDSDGFARHLANVHLPHPGLVAEVFSVLEESDVTDVLERFYANLSPASSLFAGRTFIMWPTSTHSHIVETAFDNLGGQYLESVQTGSRYRDHEGVDFRTMFEKNAHEHAMTPASKVKELKSIEKAQEWARTAAKDFIKGKLADAKMKYVTAMGSEYACVYWLKAAHVVFGEAMHPVMDNWSPAHRDFQVFDGSEVTRGAAKGAVVGSIVGPVGAAGGAIIGGYLTTTEHSKIESRRPTEDEMNSMIDEMRLAYEMTFGGDTSKAVSSQEMNQTIVRLKKRGYKGMLIK